MIRKGDVLEKVLIEDVAAEGKCISRVDGQVVFIAGLAPGDVVDMKVFRKRKNFLEAMPLQIHSKSESRVEPFCEHFGTCGGCKWQHIGYESQLKFKQKQVVDQLTRIGKLELPTISEIVPSQETEYYRNKLEYTYSISKWFTSQEIATGEELDRRALGFHLPGKFDRILDINKCFLQPDPSNDIRNFVRKESIRLDIPFYDIRSFKGNLRNLIIRNTTLDEWMVVLQCVEFNDDIKELLDSLLKEFPNITTLHYVENNKKNETFHDLEVITYHGQGYIQEKMGDLTFRIGPKSFFQTNTKQALNLYDLVKEFGELNKDDLVYDLYSGTGTIANYIAEDVKKVIGVEYVSEAVEDAKINSEINGIENTEFYSGDLQDLLSESFLNEHGKPDLIITDPPRAGMHADVVNMIIKSGVERIVYVSCNPATQARDLEIMAPFYSIEKVQPVDMFPHTHHVENVVSLRLRK